MKRGGGEELGGGGVRSLSHEALSETPKRAVYTPAAHVNNITVTPAF